MTKFKDAPYIKDNKIFKAVSFARTMMNGGGKYKALPIELAIYKAAKYYNVPTKDVAKEMGKFGAFVKDKKNINKTYYENLNEDDDE